MRVFSEFFKKNYEYKSKEKRKILRPVEYSGLQNKRCQHGNYQGEVKTSFPNSKPQENNKGCKNCCPQDDYPCRTGYGINLIEDNLCKPVLGESESLPVSQKSLRRKREGIFFWDILIYTDKFSCFQVEGEIDVTDRT